MPLPAALMVAGALAPAVGRLASGLSKANRDQRRQLREDVDAMRSGQLGLTEAEKASARGQAVRAAEAATKGTEDELRRQAAAQGFGRGGAQMRAVGDLAAARSDSVAGATADVERTSQELAERRKADILNRLSAQAAQNRENFAAISDSLASGLGAANQIPLDGRRMMNLKIAEEALKRQQAGGA